MKRWVVTVVGGIGFLSVLVFAQTKAPETIVIKEIQKAKPAVTLSHAEHSKSFKCTECHHKYQGQGTPPKCSKCHGKVKEGNKPSLKNAFHKGCKNCHKQEKAKGKKAPTTCSGCHKK